MFGASAASFAAVSMLVNITCNLAASAARALESDREHTQTQNERKRGAKEALARQDAIKAEEEPRLKSQLCKLSKKLVEENDKLKRAASQMKQCTSELAEAKTQLNELSIRLAEESGKLKRAGSELAEVRTQLTQTKEEAESHIATERHERLKKNPETDRLEHEIGRLTVENGRLTDEIGRLRDDLKSEKDAKNKVEKKLLDVKATITDKDHGIKFLMVPTSAEQPLRWSRFKNTKRYAENIRFFTGVTSVEVFESIIDVLRPPCLSLEDRILLTLMILRLNLSQVVVGSLFSLSQSTVSRNFEFGIMTMYFCFKIAFPSMSAEMLEDTCPSEVSKRFGNHTISYILDATELEIQVPDNPEAQSATWSEYKSRNTVKLLIAVSACGFIGWVSKAYPGEISDPLITECSGFYDECVFPGQTIVADKGFLVSDALARRVTNRALTIVLIADFGHGDARKLPA
ncbi:Hypothetical Protein FCC1311_108292 [Hondaea fermentalgiana]|uniref:DDE Tnp4 domain-containing protein n=1 Tax=Hondaea fermentalgiana TaxID=2315210 RepID=A0A2R5GXU2_9STRA|nr:Hypothetical Protein FCC1311_108292 [Hondaea fermentalgiana]|eukprot:GBG34608.1 Hypothetical Protein FCC1311_108292 [Hondaea fermentalgiana]